MQCNAMIEVRGVRVTSCKKSSSNFMMPIVVYRYSTAVLFRK